MADIRVEAKEDGPVPSTTARTGAEPSLGDLVRQLATDSTTLIRQEMALARAEMRENVRSAARGAMAIAIGGVLATIGVLALTAFLIILLGIALESYWLSSLIVGGLFLIIGGVLVWTNLSALRAEELKPETTIDTLKENREWLQQEIEDAKREMR
jgi:uncharacterized membrane protein YqjE